MAYTKLGPFVDGGAPYLNAATFNHFEDAFTAATSPVSPNPTGADDTATLNAWLNGLGATRTATIQPLSYTISGTITIPANTTVTAYGAKLTGTTGAYDMVSVGSGSNVLGLELAGGTRTSGHGIVADATTGVTVQDCYIHNLAGTGSNDSRGINIRNGSTKYLVTGNRLENIHAQAITLDMSPNGTITNNSIDGAEHGIQWWGGDSSVSSTIGVRHLLIEGNRILNVTGGIWGSLGQFITVGPNDIENCADVGIDFEGCLDSSATGGTVHNATNAGLAVFYGSQRVTFTGVTVLHDVSTGPAFKAFTSTANSRIVLTGCDLTTVGTAITTDDKALTLSRIFGNRVEVTGTSTKAVRLLDCDSVAVLSNSFRVHGPTALSHEGGSDSRIENNEFTTDTDTTATGAGSAGIYLFWRSATFPCKRNRVRNNVVRGFVQSIRDDCGGDLTTYNLIENNVATTITRHTGSGYTGVVNNNRDENFHALVSVTAV